MNIYIYVISALILIYIDNKFKIFDILINNLKKLRDRLLKIGNIIDTILFIILFNFIIFITSLSNDGNFEMFSYISYFMMYFVYIKKCIGEYNLCGRIISYLLVSIISSTIFFWCTYNIPIIDALMQSFGLAFLYTNFIANGMTKEIIVFINYIFNFIICSYIIINGIKIKKIL